MFKNAYRAVKASVNRGAVTVVKGCAAGTAVAATVVEQAHAALPTGVEAGFTAIGTDITTLAGYAGPIVLLGIGYVIGLKMVKRFANKV